MFEIVDTNSDPSNIDFVIPANDDAAKSVEIIVQFLTDAIKEGLEERKVERADAAAAEQQQEEDAPQRRERKTKAARKERVKKEDSEAMKAAVVSKFTRDEDVDE